MTTAKKAGANSWVLQVQENGKTKELYIEFPQDALNQVGWDEGDTLLWEELPNGSWSITKKDENNEQDKTNPKRSNN